MVNLTIGFISNKLTLREINLNLYDLADFNERILRNKSIIITRPFEYVSVHSPQDISKETYDKFENRFKVLYCNYPNYESSNGHSEIKEYVKNEKIDVLYVDKTGLSDDGLSFDYCPTIFQIVCNQLVFGRNEEELRTHKNISSEDVVNHQNVEEYYITITNRENFKRDLSLEKLTPERVIEIFDNIIKISLNRIKKLYFNGFWSGFIEETNPINKKFFIKLFEKVYDCVIEISTFENATILIENSQTIDSLRENKKWEHTYLFSSESYIRHDYYNYDCVLTGKRNHFNIVNVPLYIPYLISSFNEIDKLFNRRNIKISDVPVRDVLVIISESDGIIQNDFLERLEKEMKIDYGGSYKNNIGGKIVFSYNSNEFLNIVSQYKFIISIENSTEDTYITEKIIYGLVGGSIPIYWGSNRISDYFNRDRIILKEDLDSGFEILKNMSDEEWLYRVNQPIFTKYGQEFNLEEISSKIRNIIFRQSALDSVYCICNKKYEPNRYIRMKHLLYDKFNKDLVRFTGTTYKNTIDNILYNRYVKQDLVIKIRTIPTRKSELSLTLNWLETFEDIDKRFRDGIFLIVESDIEFINVEESKNLDKCFTFLKLNMEKWDCVSLGFANDKDFIYNYNSDETPYRKNLDLSEISICPTNDLNDEENNITYFRKFHTRCTDSLLFTYQGIIKLLKYMRENDNYGVPFDYYLMQYFETNINFKFYWSRISYFNQLSNQGKECSTIQCDFS